MSSKSKRDNLSTIGRFLTYDDWESATNLLDYQLEIKKENRHFNTLNLFYYEGLNEADRLVLRNKHYFKRRVSNNLFWC